MSGNSPALPPLGAARNVPQHSQQQSAVDVPLFNQNEFHGVPMAYRLDDGSETPVPVIDASHRHAHYPSTEAGNGSDHQHQRSYSQQQRETYSHSESNHEKPVPSFFPPPTSTDSAAAHSSVPAREGNSEQPRRYSKQGEKKENASPTVLTPAEATAAAHASSGRENDSSDNMQSESNSENSAGVIYNSVVKPVFSPFQELRARQQQQQQHLQQQSPQLHLAQPLHYQRLYPQPYAPYPLPYQQQQPDSHYSAQPMGEYPQQVSTHYAPPPSYTLSYAQPLYLQTDSAYANSNRYTAPTHMALSTVTVPNTMVSSGMGYQSQLYSQQHAYQMPYPQLYSAEAAAEAQRLNESPDWNTGLFGLSLDPLSSIDACLCNYCTSSAHFNALYREEQGLFLPMIAGLFCADCWCASVTPWYSYPWSALALHTFVIRREIRRRYGIQGNPFIVTNGIGAENGGGNTNAQEVTVTGAGPVSSLSANAVVQSREEAAATTISTANNSTNSNDLRNATGSTAAMDSLVKQQPTSKTNTPDTNSQTNTQDTNKNTNCYPHATTSNTLQSAPPSGAADNGTDAAAPAAAASAVGNETILVTPKQSWLSLPSSLHSVKWLELGADLLISLFCTPCAVAQHHREMSLRGEWPGKIVFSRECFCGERDQVPSTVPVTTMI